MHAYCSGVKLVLIMMTSQKSLSFDFRCVNWLSITHRTPTCGTSLSQTISSQKIECNKAMNKLRECEMDSSM